VPGSEVARIIRFGVFEVDLHSGELRRNGLKVKLQEQPFQILALLLQHPREVVTREELRRRLWPADTFIDFEHGLNAAVKRLRDALGDDADNPRFVETVPRRGYRLLADASMPGSGQPEGAKHRPTASPATALPLPVRALVLSLLIVAVVGFGGILYTFRAPKPSAMPPMRTIPLTTSPGAESEPAFSRDGEQVAFVWDGNTTNRTDVYVKRIGTDRPLQLTQSNGFVCCPVWSSDDRYVAFERCSSENPGIFLVPSLGGPERRLRKTGGCNGISWSPTGQLLVFSEKSSPDTPWSLFLMSLDDLQPHQLTFPTANVVGDQNPVFSPDGKSVAFMRIVGENTPDVYVVPVFGGPARQLTFDERLVSGITWTADGKRLIFSSRRDGGQSLWTMPLSGGEPERLNLGGAAATDPTVSREGDKLAYTQGLVHPNLWAIEITDGAAMHRARLQPFFPSATYNNGPQFSPNGKKVAFASQRSGDLEIWTCDVANCSEPQQLTFQKLLVARRDGLLTASGLLSIPDRTDTARSWWSTPRAADLLLLRMAGLRTRYQAGRRMAGSSTFHRIVAVLRRFGKSPRAEGSLRKLRHMAGSRRSNLPTAGSCTTPKITSLVFGGCQAGAVMKSEFFPSLRLNTGEIGLCLRRGFTTSMRPVRARPSSFSVLLPAGCPESLN
jgi:Tol biopolymer transport system component/DNA-binding winged helix-turn-helix (wHTH) protein